MDDVLGHVMLAIGNEDLGAKHLVAAVRLRLGTAAHHGQVAAGLRLGQVHGAGPLAADEFFQVHRLQFVGAGGQQRFDRAVGQQRAQRKAQVGAVHHLDAGRADGLGQALAAKVGRVLQALPAAFGKLLEGFLEAGRGRDLAVAETAGIAVAVKVQRCHHALVELGAFLQHRLCGVEAGVLECGNLGDLLDTGKVLEVEQHVFDGGLVGHSGSPGYRYKKGIANDAREGFNR